MNSILVLTLAVDGLKSWGKLMKSLGKLCRFIGKTLRHRGWCGWENMNFRSSLRLLIQLFNFLRKLAQIENLNMLHQHRWKLIRNNGKCLTILHSRSQPLEHKLISAFRIQNLVKTKLFTFLNAFIINFYFMCAIKFIHISSMHALHFAIIAFHSIKYLIKAASS